jgi:hypothetical protein
LSAFFRKAEAEKGEMSDDELFSNKRDLSTYTRALLAIADAADIDSVIQMVSTRNPVTEKRILALLDAVGQYPYDEDPVLEQHAVFSLELATRTLLANKDRANDLFKHYLNLFEMILGKVTDKYMPAPFVLERIVVTVLRCSIHMYDLPEVRLHLP